MADVTGERSLFNPKGLQQIAGGKRSATTGTANPTSFHPEGMTAVIAVSSKSLTIVLRVKRLLVHGRDDGHTRAAVRSIWSCFVEQKLARM